MSSSLYLHWHLPSASLPTTPDWTTAITWSSGFHPCSSKIALWSATSRIVSNNKSDCVSSCLKQVNIFAHDLISSPSPLALLFVLQPLWPELYTPPMLQAPSQGFCNIPAVPSARARSSPSFTYIALSSPFLSQPFLSQLKHLRNSSLRSCTLLMQPYTSHWPLSNWCSYEDGTRKDNLRPFPDLTTKLKLC